MINSMTGYGKSASEINGYIVEVESKSLNNRYLELSIKLPQALQFKEYEIREAVKSYLKRGKIYITVSVKPISGSNTDIFFNEKKINEIFSVFDIVKSRYNIKEEVRFEHLLAFKDAFSPELDQLTEEHFGEIKSCILKSVEQLNLMRAAEGNSLSADLISRIQTINIAVEKIESSFRNDIAAYFEKLKARVKEIITEPVNEERMEMEMALLAERSDITEECVRLKSHLLFFENILKNENEAGKKLNFICQEMHREANTIASKSISTEIIHSSVFIREEIEKIREQVQNIE